MTKVIIVIKDRTQEALLLLEAEYQLFLSQHGTSPETPEERYFWENQDRFLTNLIEIALLDIPWEEKLQAMQAHHYQVGVLMAAPLTVMH